MAESEKSAYGRSGALYWLGGACSLAAAAVFYGLDATLAFRAWFFVGLAAVCCAVGGLARRAARGRGARLYRAARALLLLGAVSFVCLEGLVAGGMRTDSPERCRYVIILGAGLTGDHPSVSLQGRLETALRLLRQYPEARAIASGGVGNQSVYSEADVMKWFLMEHGIAAKRILKEEQATRTDENFQFGKRAVREAYGEELDDLAIATSDYHMFRSRLIAAKYCRAAYGVPAASPPGVRFNFMLREYFALVKMGVLEIYSAGRGAVFSAGRQAK